MEKFKAGDLVLVAMGNANLKATGVVFDVSEDILKVKIEDAFLFVNPVHCKKISPFDYDKVRAMSLKVKELAAHISSLAHSLEKNILSNSCPLPYIYKVNFLDFTSKVSDAAALVEVEILSFINNL